MVNMEQKHQKMKYKAIDNPPFTNFIKKRLHKLYRGRIVSFICPVCGQMATVVCSIYDESVYAHCSYCGSYVEFEKNKKRL